MNREARPRRRDEREENHEGTKSTKNNHEDTKSTKDNPEGTKSNHEGTKSTKNNHEDTKSRKEVAMIRIVSHLNEQTEACVADVIDSGIAVHREVGPGYTEPTYRSAMRVELTARGIPFNSEKTFTVSYRGEVVGLYRLDFVVRDCVVVELKAVKSLEPVHVAQLMAYLKASKLRVGLLMNFSGATLKEGLKRIVL